MLGLALISSCSVTEVQPDKRPGTVGYEVVDLDVCEAPDLDAQPIQVSSADLLVAGSRTMDSTEIPYDELAHYVAADTRDGLTYLAGVPGLAVVDHSGETPTPLSQTVIGDLDFVHVFADGSALMSGPQTSVLVDVTDPSAPFVREVLQLGAVAAVAETDDTTWVLTVAGELREWRGDVVATGLGSSRDLAVVGDNAFIAERSLGLSVISIRTGERVKLRTESPPTSIEVVGDVAFLGLGSGGVELFDVSDPGSPQRLGVVDLPGTVTDLTVDRAGTLWAATLDGVAVLDISRPRVPALVGHLLLPEFSLGLGAMDSGVVVAGWSYVHTVQRGDDGPVLEVSDQKLTVSESGTVTLKNPSSSPLALFRVSGVGVQVSEVGTELGPGETTQVEVTLAGSQGELCIATDDPAMPLRRIPVHRGSGIELTVGQPAPPLTLTGLDGTTYALDQQTRPVVLVFFATWCPVCLPELDDVQARASTWDAEVWLVASVDHPTVLEPFVEQRGITLPVLVDPDAAAYAEWQQAQDFQTLFPQNWVVDADGTLVYASTHYEPDAIMAATAGGGNVGG